MSYAGKTRVDSYAGSPSVARCKEEEEMSVQEAPTNLHTKNYQLNNACALRRWKHVDLIWRHGYDTHNHGLNFLNPSEFTIRAKLGSSHLLLFRN